MKRNLHEIQEGIAPAPDAIVRYKSGEFGPMMFHYLAESCNLRHVAQDHGFEIRFLDLESDQIGDPDGHALAAYEAGDTSKAIELWNPEPPNGWALAGAADSDEGLYALFLRKIAEASPSGWRTPERGAEEPAAAAKGVELHGVAA